MGRATTAEREYGRVGTNGAATTRGIVDRQRAEYGGRLIGLIVTVVLAVAAVLLGAEYNVLSRLDLPRIPVDEGSLTAGGLVALLAIVLVTLLAAVAGGKQGTHYHRKIDRTGGIHR
jgi:hypothetical protein